MNLESIKQGGLKAVFDTLEDTFKANGIDFYMIGAIARNIWYAKGDVKFLTTKDVDFAVMIGSREDYKNVREELFKRGYTESGTNAFVVISPEGLQIDLLPFGALEIDEEVKFEGKGLTSIKVNGFQEVYNMGTADVILETGHQFKIATLPAIVLLKFIAYDDRPELRFKDARDIINIIDHYFNLESEFIYENHADLFGGENEDITLEEISAMVIAREIKKMIRENKDLNLRLARIVSGNIGLMEKSTLIRNMVNESGKDVEKIAAILEAMLKHLKE
ncbi:nucleotidyl transferase AbiEii/AbiGii toxin family protein [Pedobacter miscanthi]|uniref:Nucleotidyltransferase n=1 Tax=Pedobacter miscanthi TaxID=2259170 RepID=A0A366LCN1_9SPHI|nr:nucleotidyl transferase AbiEii/AbiGii toxin family protein [Pedobacter miscanthi]RBQ11540.1 hypothetical protein DRW42_03505 [Pedobacter miscanthi]